MKRQLSGGVFVSHYQIQWSVSEWFCFYSEICQMGLYLEKIRSDFRGNLCTKCFPVRKPVFMSYCPIQASPTKASYLSIYLSDGTVSKNYRSAKKVFHPQFLRQYCLRAYGALSTSSAICLPQIPSNLVVGQ